MSDPKPLLCYRVEDDDPENTMIVFARSSVEAKRRFSNQHWDGDSITGISATRCKSWDQYAPGPVPALEMIDDGWYFECHGCYTRISRDNIGEPIWHGETPPGPDAEIMEPVEPRRGEVFCCQSCCDDEMAQRRRTRVMAARAKAIVKSAVLRRWPGVDILNRPGTCDCHIYVNRTDGHLLIHTVAIHFETPGMQHGGCVFRVGDEAWQKARIERQGPLSRRDWNNGYGETPYTWPKVRPPLSDRSREATLSVANGDKAVWDAWLAAQKHPEPEHV